MQILLFIELAVVVIFVMSVVLGIMGIFIKHKNMTVYGWLMAIIFGFGAMVLLLIIILLAAVLYFTFH